MIKNIHHIFRHVTMLFIIFISLTLTARSQSMNENYKIEMEMNGQIVSAIIDDTPAGRDFYNMLPLFLTFNDYHSTEKISYLPKRLPIEGADAGIQPETGDITYYTPWGNIAIFYKSFRYSNGLIKLGRITEGLEILVQAEKAQVTIKKAQ